MTNGRMNGADGPGYDVARGERMRLVSVLALVALIAFIGWAYLTVMIADMLPAHDMGTLGPGMGIFNFFNGMAGLDEVGRALLASLCATPGASHFGMPGTGAWGARDVLLVFVMWAAMSAAMMLPTAIPMVMAYAAKGAGRAGILLISAGYLSIWLAFSLLATLAQWGLTSAMLMTPVMAAASPVFAGSIFLMAGAYQFTPLKNSCLVACRNPFPLAGVKGEGAFAEGIRQGLLCLGCCWALMSVMFAVGVMNVVWMALLGMIMAVEKVTATRWLTPALGVALLAMGAGTWIYVLIERGAVKLPF